VRRAVAKSQKRPDESHLAVNDVRVIGAADQIGRPIHSFLYDTDQFGERTFELDNIQRTL
jgi:hypothetical protein